MDERSELAGAGRLGPRERSEVEEDEALDEEISRDAQKSGHTEDDAVEIVRQYRQEKRGRQASS